MLLRLGAACLGLAVVIAVCAPAMAAQKAKAVPNIWGVWLGVGVDGEGHPAQFHNTPWPTNPDFTEWGAEESKRLASPITPGECNPWTPQHFMGGSALFPTQILQGGNQIVIHYEGINQPRRIYTDGRKHPPKDEWLPSFLGHSIGHWEGDTLVVDTVGTNGRARPMNGYVSGAVFSKVETTPRLPSSDQLHVVERIRLVGKGDYLEDAMTIEDPKTYRKPFSVKHYWQRRPDLDLYEYVCDDNARPDAEGQIPLGTKR